MKNYIKCGICFGKHNVGSNRFKKCQKKAPKVIHHRMVEKKNRLLEQLRIINFHLRRATQ